MKPKGMLLVAVCILGSLTWLARAELATAKDWPNEPIHLLMGWGAGGSTDLISRMLSESLSKSLKTPVIVENRTGAAGLLALSLVSKAKPDGYTLGFMSCTAITEKPFLREVPFDPIKGFPILLRFLITAMDSALKWMLPGKPFRSLSKRQKNNQKS